MKEVIIVKFAFILLLLAFISCNTEKRPIDDNALNGEELAIKYCSSCHLYTPPELLSKEAWKAVLPQMGNRLGIYTEEFDPRRNKPMDEAFFIEQAGVFPKQALVSDSTWLKIQRFYEENAPEKLEVIITETNNVNQLFKSSFPKAGKTDFPVLTMLTIDSINHRLLTADAGGSFVEWSSDFQLVNYMQLPSPTVHMEKDEETGEVFALNIGLMHPNDVQTGGIVSANLKDFSGLNLLFRNLQRPVFFNRADLDQDGKKDIIVCGFGNLMGKLAWYKNTGSSYEEHIIKQVPGAIKVYTIDIDQDQDLDIVALMCQGDEGIRFFENNNGKLEEKIWLRFHPVYGSSDFELLDFDGDKDLDIVMTNGDNGDFSNILKPYHGIRIFLNDGGFNFEMAHFFPMHGASKVRVRDFDKDGDYDLIACSFYADFDNAADKSIVFLENKGNGAFESQYFPQAIEGRWLVMDAGDLDGDGDEDVVLGSYVLGTTGISTELSEKWQIAQKHILYLENQLY